MVLDIREFSKLTTLIFAASLDQNKWQDFLEHLTRITGVYTHMFGHDLTTNTAISILSSNYDPDFVETYNDYYAEKNLWVPGFFDQQVGRAISSEVMCSRSVMEKTEFYNDWVLPQEDVIAGGGSILSKESDRMFVIGGNIRRKDEHLELEWLQLISFITPHLQHAFEINRVIAREKINSLAQPKGLNTDNAAVFIVNNFGRIVFANEVAEEMVCAGDFVAADINTKLKFLDDSASAQFERAIHSLNLMNGEVSSYFVSAQLNDKSNYSCRTARFDPSDLDISLFGIFFRIDQPCLLLTVNKIDVQGTKKSKLISKFGVTQVEAEVVLKLVAGQTLRDISEQRGVSIYTVRNQLKSAMSKMDVRRQMDLIKLVE